MRAEAKEWTPKERSGCDARHTHVPVKWIVPEGNSKRKTSSDEEKNMNRKKKATYNYYECLENKEGESENIIESDNSTSSENQQGDNVKDDKMERSSDNKKIRSEDVNAISV